MKKTSARLADGREIVYYDSRADAVREAVDRRPLDPGPAAPGDPGGAASGGADLGGAVSGIRFDPLLAEWTAHAAHRQSRTYHPPADQCPLCPSRNGRLTEIPEPDYEVAVFENRFPSFAGGPGPLHADGPQGLFAHRPGAGRCEVVCFTPDHKASFADLDERQARLVLDAWTDRTAELSRHPGVAQVFCFENRGEEIGVTLGHPHGQIYGYPFVTPRTARMLSSVAGHRARTGGRNLFDDVLDAELTDGSRVVLTGRHWVAFVPYAAHWPYEVHLYPRRRVPDLTGLEEAERAEFPGVYLALLRGFDRIFGPGEPPTPYISAWHQAPVEPAEAVGPGDPGEPGGVRGGRADFALHLELFTIRRTSGKLKFLAGSESGMNVFINDVPPEAAARRLREAVGK